MKTTCSVLLVMLVLAAPAAVQAQFTLTTNDGTITIAGYSGTASEVAIPATINGLPVTGIGNYAFEELTNLTGVMIGKNVTSIGDGAFSACYNLSTVTIPGNVTSIGESAFDEDSSLTNAIISTGVTSIGDFAFAQTSLSSVMIPVSVTNIGIAPFASCFGLSSITVDSENPFFSSVNGVLFDKSQTMLIDYPYGLGGIYAIPASVKTIGGGAFEYDNLTSVTIPASVVNIGEEAFYNCSLTNVTLPSGVNSIGDAAFADCIFLSSITIPGSVTNIEEFTFANCFHLTNIYFTGNAPSADATVFEGDGTITIYYLPGTAGWSSTFAGMPTVLLNNSPVPFTYTANAGAITITGYTGSGGAVIIPATINGLPVTSIGDNAFEGLTDLADVVISTNVTNIGEFAFSQTSLTSVTIPDSVASIGFGAFSDCTSLEAITVDAHNSFYSSRNGVLFDKSQAALVQYPPGLSGSYAIPAGVTTIGDGAFFACHSLSTVTIPGGVTKIGDEAFDGCTALTSVTIPGSVRSIGVIAFSACSRLVSVTIPGSVTNIGAGPFEDCGSLRTIAVVAGNSFYSSVDGVLFDKSHGTLVQYPPGLSGSYAVPATVTRIDGLAFTYCGSLASVTIPASVTNIGVPAFEGCISLNAITVGSQNLFYSSANGVLFDKSQTTLIQYPPGLDGNYTIPYSVTSIGDYAFFGCNGLTNVTIPASLTNLEEVAFADCASLNSVYFQGNAPTANSTVFESDPHTTVYYLPGATGWSSTFAGRPAVPLNSSSQSQFGYMTNVDGSSITITGYTGSGGTAAIPATINGLPVTGIGYQAFYLLTSLTNVTIPSSVTNIADQAFVDSYGLVEITVDAQNPDYSSLNGVLFDKSQTTLIQYPIGRGGTYLIPAGVTSLGDYAFFESTRLTNVTIPDSVTNIGLYALAQCPSLTGVTIPNSVTSIDDLAFFFCSGLTNVTIPGSVISIGDQAFNGCASLTNATIESGVISIGASAFAGTGLISVTIPGSVTNIGDEAFESCAGLTSIIVAAQNSFYSSADGVLFDKSQTTLIQYPLGQGRNYTIPGGVANIGDGAFAGSTNLASVTIPASVTNIGDAAFSACPDLTAITVVAQNSFYSSVNGVLFDNSQATLLQYPIALGGSYTIPASVTSLADGAFENALDLTSVTIPDGVTNIGVSTFANCTSLTNARLPQSLISVGFDAFYSCTSLGSLTIPASLANMGYQAFIFCSGLTNLKIADGVTTIGFSAFAFCSSLTSVTIPASVTSIDDGAFSQCSSLTTVYFSGNAPDTDASAFYSDTSATVYYLPGTTGWTSPFAGLPAVLLNPVSPSQFGYMTNAGGASIAITDYTGPGGVVIIPANINGLPVTSIGYYAFYASASLTSVVIPATVTSIGNGAFENCSSLINAIIPDSVTSIGQESFAETGLISVTIPASVTNIAQEAFSYCADLTEITVVTSNEFYSSVNGVLFNKDQTTLIQYPGGLGGSYMIPASVANIALVAFSDCVNLTAITVAANNPFYSSVNGVLFNKDQTTLIQYPGGLGESYTIAGTVTNIGDLAFFSTLVTNVTIPSSVTSISDFAFYECTSLSSVYFKGNAPKVGSTVFGGDNGATIFYVPGTTGWRPTLDGLPVRPISIPKLTVTAPHSGQSVSSGNDVFIVNGTTTDKESVTNVAYQLNGGSWMSATPGNSWSNWTATVTPSSGANTISGYAQDINGTLSPTVTVKFQFVPSATLAVKTNGLGFISPVDNGKLLTINSNYTVTASPGKNWVFSNWVASGSENFVSNNPILRFNMQSNLILTANFVTNPFLGIEGTYNGLFYQTNAGSPLTEQSSGFATISITHSSKGAYSAVLKVDGGSYSFSGAFDLNGNSVANITRKGDTPVALSLHINLNLEPPADYMTGSVEAANWDGPSGLLADLAYFNGTTLKASNYAGRYTVVLPGSETPATAPGGDSVLEFANNLAGNAVLTGSLADNTVVSSRSAPISKEGFVPVYYSYAPGTNLIFGWLNFTNFPSQTVLGDLIWFKLPTTAKVLYSNGFGVQSNIIGSFYKPASTSTLVSNGTLAIVDFSQGINLVYTNVSIISNKLSYAKTTTNQLNATITATTGVISLSFRPTGAKANLTGKGVVLQNSPYDPSLKAAGWFMGANQSGYFLLTQ